uniref:26S proteasome non-ATPase regulatory subunit 9 n=1 Tax=Homalodisca liturata TaxID=320908 RepID=A0A1B6JR76_9HEMI
MKIDKMTAVLNYEMKNEVLNLMTEKNKIEAEIQQFYDVLSANNIGMHEPLVDSEGFPRNDIDVYQVRTARHRIICLQNDHKSTMLKIEAGLHKLHAGNTGDSAAEGSSSAQLMLEPFACITLVSAGSPADLCGLQANDQLLEFGSVNKGNFKSMQDIATVVRHSTGQMVNVTVKRKGRHSSLHFHLTPQPWSGQGLIGCKIDPLPVDAIER